MFRNPVIWIQPSDSIDSSWVSTAECVWEGPQWLESKQCLEVEFYLEFEYLFKMALKIPDASQTDVVNDLLLLKSHGGDKNAFAELENDEILEEAEKRYHYLSQKDSFAVDSESPESLKALRFNFEGSALVYIPTVNAWYPPSQCVWAESSVKIPGKASIADTYPLRETFFTTVLKISKPTVDMYIDSLIAEAKGKASAAQIKETMALICSLGFGDNDFSSLGEAKVLPIKLANGACSFASASSKDVNFAIVENNIHLDAFKGKIVVLDFSLEEIRDCRPLLLAMGLEERFSSKIVKEVTDVRGGSQDHETTRILRIKSQAIVRYAIRHRTSMNTKEQRGSID